MSPRGRHEARAAHPTDEPWTRTSDRSTWRAYKNGRVLTVSRLIGGGWQALVERQSIPGLVAPGAERSPVLPTRLAAQRWADSRAGGTR